ncbi:MAG: PKD domain-containing protein [Gemmatimonadetes bacterium]|nr:PKD domain-containing protein [Gemmatimonadota bacterium]
MPTSLQRVATTVRPHLRWVFASMVCVLVLGACSGDSTGPGDAPNQSPTASFTFTCTDLTCSFDGAASSDSDGTVASYAWTFGDGTSAAGATATHAYAAAGSFDVVLTVTDNGGASGSTSRQVNPTAAAAGPLGSTILGEAVNDQFGRALAISDDGTRIVAGAPTNSGNLNQSGHVRVFEWSGTSWDQLGADFDGGSAGQLIGEENTIAISGDGNRIAIGRHRANGNGGTVQVYEYVGSGWNQVGSTISGNTGRQLGYSVALSTTGDRVAVGVPNAGTVGNAEGAVRVYALSGGAWSQLGTDIMGEAPGDRSGVSVDLSGGGDRVAVGAQGNDGAGSGAGQVRVHAWSGSAWVQVGQDMDGNGNGSNELFGMAVSISRDGTRVAGWGAQSGDYAKVFELVAGTWVQMGPDFSVPAAFNLHMPISLSADGSRIAIGRPFAGTNTNGTLTLYDWTGSAWIQAGMEIMGDQPTDNLGWAVALSADGHTVATGLRGYPQGGLRGAVRVYTVP